MRLFTVLLSLLFPPRETERVVDETTKETFLTKYKPALYGAISALLPYRDDIVRAVILEAKFHKNEKAIALLGEVLAKYLASNENLVLVPIPLGAKRRRERGYNQVEAVCQTALPYLKNSVRLSTDILVRVRETAPQTKLSREARKENMNGAFVAHGIDPGLSYVLIDDVLTTGATLGAGMDALLASGAKKVSVVALAH